MYSFFTDTVTCNICAATDTVYLGADTITFVSGLSITTDQAVEGASTRACREGITPDKIPVIVFRLLTDPETGINVPNTDPETVTKPSVDPEVMCSAASRMPRSVSTRIDPLRSETGAEKAAAKDPDTVAPPVKFILGTEASAPRFPETDTVPISRYVVVDSTVSRLPVPVLGKTPPTVGISPPSIPEI